MFAFKLSKLMIKKGFSHIGIFFLYLLAWLPLPVLQMISRLLYYPLYYLIGYRKKVVRENLEKSFPEKSRNEIIQIEKAYFRYFTDLVLEIVQMSAISRRALARRVTFKRLEEIEKHLKNGQGVLACTGHFGNWEICALALSAVLQGGTDYVIYKPLSNKVVEEWFLKMRTRFGAVFIAMRQTLRTVVATKDQPTLFCFASDQSPVRGEVQYTLPFLHQPTAALLGLEKIALQTNRPIIYFDVKVLKRGYYEVDCVPICPDPRQTKEHEITDLFFKLLEDSIRQAPPYWLWSHRRWKLNR